MQSNDKTTEKTMNPFFSQKVSDYLETNGFERSEGSEEMLSRIYFGRFPQLVVVEGNTAQFMVHDDGVPGQRSPGYSRFASFAGIEQLEFFDWMLLLHLTGTVKLRQLGQPLKREQHSDVQELVNNIFEHFTPKELPICY